MSVDVVLSYLGDNRLDHLIVRTDTSYTDTYITCITQMTQDV